MHILQRHGVNLVRLRLFVNPSHDFNATLGATQDLTSTIKLAKRAKTLGLRVLLDLHYADTWADPAHQPTPSAWRALGYDDLRQQVRAYTAEVLRQMNGAGAGPDIVAIGNEITAGMLWPIGKLDKTDASWDRLAGLLSAGTVAVRDVEPHAKIMLHISGGGKAGLPAWFFDHLDKRHVDYDLVGLSFYPTWNDDFPTLQKNLTELAKRGKDVVIAEIGYPSRGGGATPQCRWPMTPAGQMECLRDVVAAVHTMPGGHGRGVIWWYAEAVPVKGLNVWEGGRMGLFDANGAALPAMNRLIP